MTTSTSPNVGGVPGLRGFTEDGDPIFERDHLDDRLAAIDDQMRADGVSLRHREAVDHLLDFGEIEAFGPYMAEIAELAPQLIERAWRRQASLRVLRAIVEAGMPEPGDRVRHRVDATTGTVVGPIDEPTSDEPTFEVRLDRPARGEHPTETWRASDTIPTEDQS